jgi:hypothetical protein
MRGFCFYSILGNSGTCIFIVCVSIEYNVGKKCYCDILDLYVEVVLIPFVMNRIGISFVYPYSICVNILDVGFL